MINRVMGDAGSILPMVRRISDFLTIPITLIAILYFLARLIGLSLFPGIGVILISLFFNLWVAKRL